MSDLKIWFLTWSSGVHKVVIAPDSNSAINVGGYGIPSTIHQINRNDITYKIMEKIDIIEKELKDLKLLIGGH